MQTDLSFLDDGKPWPPEGEAARIKAMIENIDFFNDKRYMFPVTQEWLTKDTETKDKKQHIIISFGKVAVGELLNGTLPTMALRLASEEKDSEFQPWINKNYELWYELGTDWSRCGVGVAKVSRFVDEDDKTDARVKIRSVRPDCWIPVCYPDDDREFKYHILFKESVEKDAGGKETTWLYVEIHSKKWIEYRLYQIDSGGKLTRMDLSEKAEDFDRYGLDSNDRQTIPGWCVFPIWNTRNSDTAYGIPDGTFSPGPKSYIDRMERAFSVRAFIHDSHSKPTTLVNEAAIFIDPNTGRVKWDPDKTIFVQSNGTGETNMKDVVTYVVPPLESSAEISQEIHDCLEMFVNTTEFSAASITGADSANVTSGRALSLELTPTTNHLKKFQAAFWDAIPQILEAASRLSLPDSGDLPKFTADEVEFVWPEPQMAVDQMERAQEWALMVQNGIYSPQQVHREKELSEDESDKIMEELKANEPAVQEPGEEPLQIELPGAEGEGEGAEV
ncbi:MAG: phage portal protein [Candidatus Omnitrophica bacterium]|nr:phage portal protein [Candidatus Omnitrophota bacterium]